MITDLDFVLYNFRLWDPLQSSKLTEDICQMLLLLLLQECCYIDCHYSLLCLLIYKKFHCTCQVCVICLFLLTAYAMGKSNKWKQLSVLSCKPASQQFTTNNVQ